MRKYFSILTCLLLGVTLSQCELENPNYPVEPIIRFQKIEFAEAPGFGTSDTLQFTIAYRDGDSDLGIDNGDFTYWAYPYHPNYYFLENNNGDTTKVSTGLIYDSDGYPTLLVNSSGIPGKLVTNKTRNKGGYGYLPIYENNCEYYWEERIFVLEGAADASYNILDTLYTSNNRYFLIQEPLLYEKNENHYNIHVEFYSSDDGINFNTFNFIQYCYNFDGLFPFIGKYVGTFYSSTYNGTWVPFKIVAINPWKGLISYKMMSPSFLHLFSTKKMKLKIKIKDRALHTSNVIETPVFTLDEIRKN